MTAATITPADFHIFEDFFTHLGLALSRYVNNVAFNIIDVISPGVRTLLAIYVCLWGWSMMRGVINEPIGDGVGRMVKLSVITAIALNIGFYNDYLSTFLFNSPDALATAISKSSLAAGTASSTSTGTASGNYLDSLLNQMFDFGSIFIKQGYESKGIIADYRLIIIGLALQGVGAIAAGYGAFLMALSKISLSVILAIGPIFVLLLIFDGTKKFFDAWIGQAINAIFVMALTAATLKLILNLLQEYLTHNGVIQMPGTVQAIEALILAAIGILVLLQVPSMASALSGGVAIGTLGAVAWAAKKTPAGAVVMGKATAAAAGAAAKGLNAIRPSNVKATASAAMGSIKAGAGKVAAGAKADYQATAGAARSAGSVGMNAIRKISGSGGNSVSKG